MKRIKSIDEFYPGRVMYHVYGVSRTETTISEDNISKYIILEHPKKEFMGRPSDSYFFKHVVVYKTHAGEESEYINDSSLNDNGILCENNKLYNLNRLFASKEDAMMFLQELRDDKFSDPDDAAFAKRFTPLDHEERHQMFDFTYEEWCQE